MQRREKRPPERPETFGVGRVRVRATGRYRPNDSGEIEWYWRAERYQDGKPRRVWTGWGTKTEATRAVAAEVAAGAEDRPVARAAPPSAIHTVADLMERWVQDIHAENARLPEEDRRSVFTLKAYVKGAEALCFWKRRSQDPSTWRTHPIAEVELRNLTVADLEGHVRSRRQQGAAPGTIRNELDMFRRAWKYGFERRWHRHPLPPRPRLVVWMVRPKHTPTRGEIVAVLAQLDPEGWVWMVLLLYAATGCRLSELATLEQDRVEFTTRPGVSSVGSAQIAVLHVVGKRGKRSPAITDPTTVAALQKWMAAHPEGQLWGVAPNTVRQVNVHLRRACKAAGVTEFTTNGFRRAVDYDLLRNPEVDLLAYRAQTGKSPSVALTSYTAPTLEDQVRAADAARLGALPRGEVSPLTRTDTPAQPRRFDEK